MTEDEANKKWCPMVKLFSRNGTIEDNRQYNGTTTNCIASACMMWRWIQEYDGIQFGAPQKFLPLTKGYCGLGGKP